MEYYFEELLPPLMETMEAYFLTILKNAGHKGLRFNRSLQEFVIHSQSRKKNP